MQGSHSQMAAAAAVGPAAFQAAVLPVGEARVTA